MWFQIMQIMHRSSNLGERCSTEQFALFRGNGWRKRVFHFVVSSIRDTIGNEDDGQYPTRYVGAVAVGVMEC